MPLTSNLAASNYGKTAMATIFGLVSFGHQIGDAVGVMIGGVFRDLTGSYQFPFTLVVIMLLTASALSFMIDDRSTRVLRQCAPQSSSSLS